GEQVPEAEGAQDHHRRPRGIRGGLERGRAYGHDDSVEGAITSSRGSQPGGWQRANRTAWATSSGRLSLASAAGLYCSGRPSKKAVCIPPRISRVTPIPPAVSGGRALAGPDAA